MKLRLLSIAMLFFGSLGAQAQVTENFNKTTISSGSLACWESSYLLQVSGTARMAAGARQSISPNPRLSMNTTTPINGSASLRATESMTAEVMNGTNSYQTITTPAIAQTGSVVNFKVRVNSADFPNTAARLYVIVLAGDFMEYHQIFATDITSTLNIQSTIDATGAGQKIQIQIQYSNFLPPSTVNMSYSLDIDDFSTTANIDPSSACASVLPVKLASFSATKTENVVNVDWTTTEETNSNGFEVQRSADTKQWVAVGQKSAAGENNGLLKYQFTDASPLAGISYYRLKMIDNDGTYEFSQIRSVELGNILTKTVLYPNPVVDKLYLKDAAGNELSAGQLREVAIFNLLGAELYKSNSLSGKGIDVNGLSAGIYLLNVKLTDGTRSTHKLVVRK